MKTGLKKLRGGRGESIAEALIALLISSVGLMMLAGMITSSVRMITRSKAVLHSYYERSTVLETRGAGYDGAMEMRLESGDSPGMEPETFQVYYYENRTISAKPVISYRAQ